MVAAESKEKVPGVPPSVIIKSASINLADLQVIIQETRTLAIITAVKAAVNSFQEKLDTFAQKMELQMKEDQERDTAVVTTTTDNLEMKSEEPDFKFEAVKTKQESKGLDKTDYTLKLQNNFENNAEDSKPTMIHATTKYMDLSHAIPQAPFSLGTLEDQESRE
ncbi:UNVERIFIED_CONTAM: hypothetical protein K2H54_013336 [Gekko kuhli]